MRTQNISMYHVTLLSNFARAFDKYQRLYRKVAIPESTHPNEFYVLPASEIGVGVAKASRLRNKLRIPGDTLLVLESALPPEQVKPNLRNGVGFVWPSPDLPVSRLYAIGAEGKLAEPMSVEEGMARSLAIHTSRFVPYSAIRPRSLSFLPMARGCQASCPFCFSEASASAEQKQAPPDWGSVRQWVNLAHRHGAERAVITGGGEPTLLQWADLFRLIQTCHSRFDKVVLITNGVKLARMNEADAAVRLQELRDAGLSVLAVSRHHSSEAINTKLMNLETHTPALLRAHASNSEVLADLRLRLICVLQRGGVESVADIEEYTAWAASCGVAEVCFKELYVSTSQESVYHSNRANDWSARNQIPLSLVHDWAATKGFRIQSHLPWGAPIFGGTAQSKSLRVAAYTEPSLFWERSNGIARSWNVMADGICLASLEDRRSFIEPAAVGEVQ
jgi:organic radical activating enzyme